MGMGVDASHSAVVHDRLSDKGRERRVAIEAFHFRQRINFVEGITGDNDLSNSGVFLGNAAHPSRHR